jgi:hypothetical protein
MQLFGEDLYIISEIRERTDETLHIVFKLPTLLTIEMIEDVRIDKDIDTLSIFVKGQSPIKMDLKETFINDKEAFTTILKGQKEFFLIDDTYQETNKCLIFV